MCFILSGVGIKIKLELEGEVDSTLRLLFQGEPGRRAMAPGAAVGAPALHSYIPARQVSGVDNTVGSEMPSWLTLRGVNERAGKTINYCLVPAESGPAFADGTETVSAFHVSEPGAGSRFLPDKQFPEALGPVYTWRLFPTGVL